MTDAVIASHYDANRRGGPGLVIMTNEGYDYLVARNSADEGFYLIWDGSPSRRCSTRRHTSRVSEAVKAKLKPRLPRVRSLQPLPVQRRPLLPDTRPDPHGLRYRRERAVQQRIRHRMLTLFEFQHKAVDRSPRDSRATSTTGRGGSSGRRSPTSPSTRPLPRLPRAARRSSCAEPLPSFCPCCRSSPIVLWLSKGGSSWTRRSPT